MFLDDHVQIFSSTFKQNIIHQAASMLVQHITYQKNFIQNSNGNALDEYRHRRRTNKCNSWLSKIPISSNTSIKFKSPMFVQSPSSQLFNQSMNISRLPSPSKFYHQLTLSSNASTNIIPDVQSFSQPLMLIHKKRLRRDYFLSNIHHCIQPPYSPNHFYAFDQYNLRKLQEQNEWHSKRKYSEIDDNNELDYTKIEDDFNRISSPNKQITSPLQTADHLSINKYHEQVDSPMEIEEKPESEIILLRLEKILNLCGELRTLATDIEHHLHEKQVNSLEKNDINDIEKDQSEQTLIDIYKELETQQRIDEIEEKNAPPPYQTTNEIVSIHSESVKSHPLIQTESFKTKSTSHTILRQPEDICTCFLKSIFDKDECALNPDEQEYLNQLTKAYLLGKEQKFREQHEENNKFEASMDEHLSVDASNAFDQSPPVKIETNNNNNNNQTTPSSTLFYDTLKHTDDHQSSTLINSNESTVLYEQKSSNIITAKHQAFINEPIAMKTIHVLPGIGTKYAQQLADYGFSTVRRLLGFYLMIKDDQTFVQWLHTKVQLSIHSAWLCTNALRAWTQRHL